MRLPAEARRAMVAHARFRAPEEACGLLAMDDGGDVRMVYCLSNVDRSPSSFTIDPIEQGRAIFHAERRGWAVRGVFHSHPAGPAVPSEVDLRSAVTDWVQIVVTPEGEVAAWRVSEGRAVPEPLEQPSAGTFDP